MGKATRDGDSTDDRPRKIVRREQKARMKKRKRKKDLTDLRQRLFRSNEDKESKTDGKLKKERNSKKMCKRILARPLAGIYRNGATGKEIRRSQTKLPLNDINNARLQGDVLKLLHGYDSKSEAIIVEKIASESSKGSLINFPVRNILQSTSPREKRATSPILGKVDGKKHHRDKYVDPDQSKHGEHPHRLAERKKINSERLRTSAIDRYEELCSMVRSENFEGQNFPEQLTLDPLTAIKKKLRNVYAETFRSQFLRDMIKRGTILNDSETPEYFLENEPPERTYCPTNCAQDTVAIENPGRCRKNVERHDSSTNENLFLVQEKNLNFDGKRNEVPTNHLLFDMTLLNQSNGCSEVVNVVESESLESMNHTVCEDNSTDCSHNYIDRNHPVCKRNGVKLIEDIPVHLHRIEKAKDKSKGVLFLPSEIESSTVNKKHLIKHRDQYTQTSQLLNSTVQNNLVKNNLNASPQVKMKSLKHIPAILRKCKSHKTNLFGESVHNNNEPREVLFDVQKLNVLFTPRSLTTRLNENSKKLEDVNGIQQNLNVQSCTASSPNLVNHEIRATKSFCLQTDSARQSQNDEIFVTKKTVNPAIQKTIMFTKKDLHNIGHCFHLNNVIADERIGNSSVMRQNVQQEQSYVGHRNCQKISANCYRPCSHSAENLNYSSQEYQELNAQSLMQNVEAQQKQVCEKLLLRRVQHPKCEGNRKLCQRKDHRVRYVVVDRSNDVIPPEMEHHRTLNSERYCQEDVANVGILKGVQNLQILPAEERESQIKAEYGNTVVFEEQPIKYLAFESDSKTQKIPIFMQNSKHIAPVENVELLNHKVNYRVVSCPPKAKQKVILLPAYEQKKVVYVQEENSNHSIPFEGYSHPRKLLLYRPEFQSNVQCVKESPNLCHVRVSKQNVVKINNTDFETVPVNLQRAENRDVNWEELLYRRSHEYPVVNEACARSKAVFYRK